MMSSDDGVVRGYVTYVAWIEHGGSNWSLSATGEGARLTRSDQERPYKPCKRVLT